MQITEHFSLEEAARTDHRAFILPNMQALQADARALAAIKTLCSDYLETVRNHFHAAVIVHSMFRMPQLNAVVHGQPESQHTKGEACDFEVLGYDLQAVFDWIRLESKLPYGQVILEGGPSWVHLSLGDGFRDPSRCREAFRATPNTQGEMIYTRVV